MLSQLKVGKAAGPDGIAPGLLQRLLSKGSSVLSNILNSWLSSWCLAILALSVRGPVPQKGKDPADMGSYRPIVLTSTIGKALERLIASRLSWWLEEHSYLSPWLARFYKGHSTPTSACHNSSLMDFSQPSVDPPLLLSPTLVGCTGFLMTMSKMGVPRHFTEWLSSWFINRTARV